MGWDPHRLLSAVTAFAREALGLRVVDETPGMTVYELAGGGRFERGPVTRQGPADDPPASTRGDRARLDRFSP